MTPPFSPDKPPLESAKRSIDVDMSPAAIDRRLREVFSLWDLWRCLRRFRIVDANDAGQDPQGGLCSCHATNQSSSR